WGGAIAWHLAQKFPEYLNRLAILNAAHPQKLIQELAGNVDQIRRSWYILAFQVPGIPEWLIQQNLREFIKGIFQGQAIRKSAFTTEITQIYQAALEKPGALVAAINHYRQFLLPQNWLKNFNPKPEKVTAPTLILWGKEDYFLSQKLTEGLDKLIAAPFWLKVIPDCGHWIQQEVPHTVNRELLNFFGKK
ncbi:alpha/beta fold hydrolase, partial [Hydrocoleum sp. CS-953]|uniref:alpha/beta fold hydrolase n=2 Tax=Microcoleaceae TaxID=1892252 RepID=UPI00117B5A1E